MTTKKRRFIAILTIIIGLPLSIAGAASQSVATGGFWGLVLAFGIDYLIDHLGIRTE